MKVIRGNKRKCSLDAYLSRIRYGRGRVVAVLKENLFKLVKENNDNKIKASNINIINYLINGHRC